MLLPLTILLCAALAAALFCVAMYGIALAIHREDGVADDDTGEGR